MKFLFLSLRADSYIPSLTWFNNSQELQPTVTAMAFLFSSYSLKYSSRIIL